MSKIIRIGTDIGIGQGQAPASRGALRALSWSVLSWSIALSLAPLSAVAQTGSLSQGAEQLLLEQIRLGEASYRDQLVTEAVHRLELIAPDNPQLLAAKIRLALRQENQPQAQAELDKLAQLAPDSAIYRQAKNALLLTSETGRQQLQQARLLAAAGRLPEAQQAYQNLFGQDFPTLDIAIEYWRLTARFPGQQAQAINALQQLDKQYPGNGNLRTLLVEMDFAEQRPAAAMALLQQLILEPNTQQQASERWLAQINGMPIGDASVSQLQQLLPLSDAATRVQVAALLTQQQALLANPGFRAKQRGLNLVAAGKGAAAIAPLRQALRTYPEDVALLGGLAEAYSQTDQRQLAIPLFERALKLVDIDDDNRNKWRNLLASQRYWLLIQQGDAALARQAWPEAERAYQGATRLDGQDSFGWLGLGQVALAQQKLPQAERYFKQALARDPNNGTALMRLFELKRQQSLPDAEQFLAQLSPPQRQALADNLPRLESELLQAKASPLEQTSQWPAASELLLQARQLTPDDVWLTYRLANDLRAANQPERADQVFSELALLLPEDAAQVYAHSLYLSSSEREAQALAELNDFPKNNWSQDITDLAARLEQDLLLAKARALREQGNNAGALALLRAQPSNPRLELTVADWALEDNQPNVALAQYRQLLSTEPANDAARLGEIEALIALQQTPSARSRLRDLPKVAPADVTTNRQRRLANAWAAVGELNTAKQLFNDQQTKVEQQPKSPEAALWWRDRARLAEQSTQPQTALAYYKNAMQAGGIGEQEGDKEREQPLSNNDDFTRLTRLEQTDDWLKRSIRSDAANLYRQQDTTLTFNQDYQRSSGTAGYSDLTAHVSMLQLDTPLVLPAWADNLGLLEDKQGQAFVRMDVVQMDAGSFGNSTYDADFGTCADVACNRDQSQTAEGISLGAGWQNARWRGDLGTTPLGFAVVDWVGSLSYNSRYNAHWLGAGVPIGQELSVPIGWELGVSRRPITSSLLSFAGSQDPNTQQTWGGVRVTQLALSGSYDQGEAHGVWGNADLGVLTGKNVDDNQRYRLMGGYYYKLVNEDHKRISIGANSMWWQYQKDLSGYTLGQGGYYSPQQYLSFGLPVSYRQRTADWSWELSGSYSWSRAVTDGQRPYPLPGLLPAGNNYNNADIAGDSSSGFGYTLKAVLERRLDSHWFIGTAVDIQQAKDYTPSHGLVYVRYSFGGWQGDLDMPPQPLIPYGDF